MIVQYNDRASTMSQYKFLASDMIEWYADIFGLDIYHTLIRKTI